jgi:hypothetical protein
MATRRSRALERTEGKLYPARSKTNQTVVAPTTAAAEAFLRRHSSKSATGPGPRARKGMSSQGSAGFSGRRAVLTIRRCRRGGGGGGGGRAPRPPPPPGARGPAPPPRRAWRDRGPVAMRDRLGTGVGLGEESFFQSRWAQCLSTRETDDDTGREICATPVILLPSCCIRIRLSAALIQLQIYTTLLKVQSQLPHLSLCPHQPSPTSCHPRCRLPPTSSSPTIHASARHPRQFPSIPPPLRPTPLSSSPFPHHTT